ncbi:hypothetical protein NC653_034148 [Populus alba x Populus x berolinensis]|uniref:Uncharacterized protein n=1 Tax=Populus alba x Populus x berolinensis TaxID=444605 RepID=A0AAD6LN90_9ROSI|nr:hypothetical protein NC653_034148 [Populus alba x Populus x berolinensis]
MLSFLYHKLNVLKPSSKNFYEIRVEAENEYLDKERQEPICILYKKFASWKSYFVTNSDKKREIKPYTW